MIFIMHVKLLKLSWKQVKTIYLPSVLTRVIVESASYLQIAITTWVTGQSLFPSCDGREYPSTGDVCFRKNSDFLNWNWPFPKIAI